jgi:acetyl-CoA carboxylase carboxyl transferase subunit beta
VKTGRADAILAATGAIDGRKTVVAVMDYAFMGGSMGSVVGEVLARSAELALAEKCPLVIVTSSGGARMQEGISRSCRWRGVGRAGSARRRAAALRRDPDRPDDGRRHGFVRDVGRRDPRRAQGPSSGSRVRASSSRPSGRRCPRVQRSEFLLEHGFVDLVVTRHGLKAALANVLLLLSPQAA